MGLQSMGTSYDHEPGLIYRVFPCHYFSFKSTPTLEYNSLDFTIYPMLKLLYWTSFSEVFTLYSSVFSLKIPITECF